MIYSGMAQPLQHGSKVAARRKSWRRLTGVPMETTLAATCDPAVSTFAVPLALSSFVGRESEFARLRAGLAEARLTTLLGFCGVGKTRLAREVARSLSAEGWSVTWASTSSPHFFELPAGDTVGPRLLVLDGVLPAHAEVAAEWLLRQLAADGELRCLVTAARPLGVPGEHLFPVPTFLGAREESGVELFLRRARQRAWEWEPDGDERERVREIVRRVGGLPAAIELAASRLEPEALPEVAARLEQAPWDVASRAPGGETRHRTLAALLECAEAALTAPEREMLLRLVSGDPDLPDREVLADLYLAGWVERSEAGMPRLTALGEAWFRRAAPAKPAARSAPMVVPPVDAARLEVRLLGGLSLQLGRQPVSLRGWWAKARRVFAYLVLHRGQLVGRDALLETFWPDEEMEDALHSLQSTISCVRRTLREVSGDGGSLLVSRHGGYVFDPEARCEVDVLTVERQLQEVARLAQAGDETALEAVTATGRRALLPEFPFDDWCVLRRERLREAWGDSLVRVATRLLDEGRHERAAALAEAVADVDPSDERACRLLMRAYQALERPIEAVRRFERCREALEQDLGIRPSRVTVEIYEQVRGLPQGRR